VIITVHSINWLSLVAETGYIYCGRWWICKCNSDWTKTTIWS